MFNMYYILLSVAVICFSLFVSIYGLYVLLVLRTSKKGEYLELIQEALEKDVALEELPNISMLVRAHNEEEVISKKLENIATLDYPREKMEVILIDDCSTDKTVEIAQRMLNELDLRSKIARNTKQLGANASINVGFAESENDLVLTTDADVIMDNEALIKSVKILNYLKDVGGVSGKLIPVSKGVNPSGSIETSYRDFYDDMLIAESSIYSTFPGYSALTVLKKSAFSPLPSQYGSTDGNISLATIRKGLKFIYVPQIFFYDPIVQEVSQLRTQKIRRAARLIQSMIANKDMLFNKKFGSFGKTIFPLRFMMMTISPIFFFIGSIAMILAVMHLSIMLSMLLTFFLSICIFLGMRKNISTINVLSSLVAHQFYLLMGLFYSQKKVSVWRPAKRLLTPMEP